MIDRQRLKDRMDLTGLSQSELARRVGVSQATIYKLLSGEIYGTKYLHRIARELLTTVEYITGETDDADLNAPPRAPVGRAQVLLPVELPSEDALADMFEGLLLAIDRTQPLASVSRELAQLLPTGLSRLQGRQIALPRAPHHERSQALEAFEVPATEDRGHPQ